MYKYITSFKKFETDSFCKIEDMPDVTNMTLSDFVQYTGHLLSMVDLVLAEPYHPSKDLPVVTSFVVPVSSTIDSSKKMYYHAGFRKTLDCIHDYLQQRRIDNYYSCEEERIAEELQIVRLFQPVVESIEHGVEEFDVRGTFQRLYEELKEYNECYTKQYQKGMNRMVYLLMAIKDKDPKLYYQVIARYDFAEYYRTLHELEDFPPLSALAGLFDTTAGASASVGNNMGNIVNDSLCMSLYHAYKECLDQLQSRPSYLTQQQDNIVELQKMV